jgi:hypothetical protein
VRRIGVDLDDAQMHEHVRCSPLAGAGGFVRFCERHVIIQDKETSAEVPFLLFEGQRRVVPDLVRWSWLTALKGRQLGLTWLAAAYTLWRVIYERFFQAAIINQEKQYAEDFIYRIRWIHDRLPAWCQRVVTKDRDEILRFASPGGNLAEIRSLVGGDKAARSFTGDLALFDEASRIPSLGATLGAIIPTMRRSLAAAQHGQIIVLTTSAGAEGEYADHWRETYGEGGDLLDENGVGPTSFKPVFLHWSERPGRTQAWYAARKKELDRISPVMVKREYPETPEEAFEHAEGRVYPLFTRKRNVGAIEIPDYAQRGRCVDWGESKSAFVVLWYAYVEGPPGFLIHPDCKNCIREFLAYRLDDDGKPEKKHDHCPDAVRYAVTTRDLRGLVYVYRELYRLNTVAEGWTFTKEIAEVHEMSGWERTGPESRRKWRQGDGETYELGTVADSAWGTAINEWSDQQVPTVPSTNFSHKRAGRSHTDKPFDVKMEGIRLVGDLIAGEEDLKHFYQITPEARAVQVYRTVQRRRKGVGLTMEEARAVAYAKTVLKRMRKR